MNSDNRVIGYSVHFYGMRLTTIRDDYDDDGERCKSSLVFFFFNFVFPFMTINAIVLFINSLSHFKSFSFLVLFLFSFPIEKL